MTPRLVPGPALSPGVCFFCHTHQGPVVDTMIDDGHARVYACSRCAGEHARLVGWHPPETVAALEARVRELEDTLGLEQARKIATRDELKRELLTEMFERANVRLEGNRTLAHSG